MTEGGKPCEAVSSCQEIHSHIHITGPISDSWVRFVTFDGKCLVLNKNKMDQINPGLTMPYQTFFFFVFFCILPWGGGGMCQLCHCCD